MSEFQGKRQIKRVFYSRPVALLLLLAALWSARSVWQVWQRSRAVENDRDQVAAQVAALAARQKSLAEDTAALQTTAGQERAIRSKFSVVKPGEEVITVVGSGSPSVAPAVASSSWWQKLWPF